MGCVCKKSVSVHDTNLIIESGVRNTERKNLSFSNYISLIVAKIQESDEERTVFRHWIWPYLLSKFNRYHLNNSQTLELLAELKSLISTNFGLEKDNAISQLCATHGEKLHKLENSLFFEHQRAFGYCKFMARLKDHPKLEK
jgi:hypothetical protein